MKEKIFALDIGTRSVVGIIMEKIDQTYKVIDMITEEHEERSVLDGQIHDVLSVSRVIRNVKQQLERHHGTLHKVCVAAAGRALRTRRTTVSLNIDRQPLMGQEDVTHLDLSAVQQAQYELAQEAIDSISTDYYCVGYSVLHYHLDGQPLISLIDQQGNEATVEIIATFLPKVVVESLLAALQRAELEMEALTLEPIAAIQVLIPVSMRRLNVALVDIGAGTSDIAITSTGTVTAYGMVPIAGDEITEAISDEFLLDFPLAEQAKREIMRNNEATIQDILGFETIVTSEEVLGKISGAIQTLAKAIASEIIDLNGGPPQAVMLVGGGSQTPDLSRQIADHLQLPDNRVAIRGINAIQSLVDKDQLPQGPDYVTPIGIAIAAKQNPVHYISVQINNLTIRLFDMKALAVGDGLLSAGIDLPKLYGKPGHAFMIKLNGIDLTLKGSYGSAPRIHVNGETASIERPINHGDRIFVEQGEGGQSPCISTEDLIGELKCLTITYNDRLYSLTNPVVWINDELVDADHVIEDNDRVEYYPINNISDFKKVFTKIGEWIEPSPLTSRIEMDGKTAKLPSYAYTLTKNHQNAELTTNVSNNDQILSYVKDSFLLSELLQSNNLEMYDTIEIDFNGKAIQLKKKRFQVFREMNSLEENNLIFPGNSLSIEKTEKKDFIFQDVFRFVDIDLSTIPKRFELYRNQEKSSFDELIHDGDKLSIDHQSI